MVKRLHGHILLASKFQDNLHLLVGVVGDKRKVPGRGDPLSADQEDKRHKRLHKHFWQNKLVKSIVMGVVYEYQTRISSPKSKNKATMTP